MKKERFLFFRVVSNLLHFLLLLNCISCTIVICRVHICSEIGDCIWCAFGSMVLRPKVEVHHDFDSLCPHFSFNFNWWERKESRLHHYMYMYMFMSQFLFWKKFAKSLRHFHSLMLAHSRPQTFLARLAVFHLFARLIALYLHRNYDLFFSQKNKRLRVTFFVQFLFSFEIIT